jgi:gliding motility-associated-like protein
MNYYKLSLYKKLKLFIKFLLLLIGGIFYSQIASSQQCLGSLGDKIVNITFGAGQNPGNPLSAATTNYNYVNSDCPIDGNYTVRNNTQSCFGNTWHTLTSDHTGDANGYFMLVNASYTPSAFFVDTIRGLCASSTYVFGAWILNVLKPSACNNSGVKPNITFTIEKLDGTVVGTGNTNDINGDISPTWKFNEFTFTTPANVFDVVIRIVNNSVGGCGNDIALDDITFRRCGPKITPSISGTNTTTTKLCEGSSQSFTLNAQVSAGFNNPVYQWQQSFNGNAYSDITGANSLNYTTNFTPVNAIGVYTFRLAVGEQGNINNLNCRILSEPITISILKNPVVNIDAHGAFCQNDSIKLNATGAAQYVWSGPNNFTANTNPLFVPNAQQSTAGNYAVIGTDADGCKGSSATLVNVNPAPTASVSFLDTVICADKKIQLFASGGNIYEWFPVITISNNNDQTPFVNPIDTTTYFVIVRNQFNCSDTALVNVNVIKKVIVHAGEDRVIVGNTNIQLQGSIQGGYANFYWTTTASLTNANTLAPSTFITADTKFYLTATALKNCGDVTDEVNIKVYNGIYIPNTFSPNADNTNDTWNIPALEAFPLHELIVYNRYGQIVFERKQSLQKWDGKFKGEYLPIGTYTYLIDLKNGTPILKGTVLIIR